MIKILFFGDSITDMGRHRDTDGVFGRGMGYVFLTDQRLKEKYPHQYEIINRGCSGDTINDLVNRYENDVIEQKPDVLSILIGVNDIWHRIGNAHSKASKLSKFIKLYEQMLLDIMAKLPNTKIIMCEPFFTHGLATDADDRYEYFLEVYKYAKRTKSLAKKLNIPFVKLQKVIDMGQEKYGTDCLYDGVHPNVIGASLISKEWIKTFEKKVK